MDALRLSTMTKHPLDAAGKSRVRAEKMADQFEQMFVRTMVSSLRQTSKLDEGGMFGSGPGSDTFGDWFDQNLAEQIGRQGDVGIAKSLLADLERNGETAGDLKTQAKLEAKFGAAQAASVDRSYKSPTTATPNGGFDVVL
jgi:Rod binding domain-containing protein